MSAVQCMGQLVSNYIYEVPQKQQLLDATGPSETVCLFSSRLNS